MNEARTETRSNRTAVWLALTLGVVFLIISPNFVPSEAIGPLQGLTIRQIVVSGEAPLLLQALLTERLQSAGAAFDPEGIVIEAEAVYYTFKPTGIPENVSVRVRFPDGTYPAFNVKVKTEDYPRNGLPGGGIASRAADDVVSELAKQYANQLAANK